MAERSSAADGEEGSTRSATEHRLALEALVRGLSTDPAAATVQCRPFFGGAAAYASGRIFATLTAAGLGVKLPAAVRTELLAAGAATELRYFPRGHVKRDYVLFARWETDPPTTAAHLLAALQHAARGAAPE